MRRILLLTLLLAAAPLTAETVRDLYTAEVTATGRTQQALGVASREALAQVLVKVSGTAAVLGYPSIKSALGNSRDYIQQYAFLAEDPAGEGVGVRIEFDGTSVTELVTAAGAPLWTANRPVVLAWLVANDAGGPHFVNRDSGPELTAALLTAFSRRGVPVQIPLFDLADATALRVDEVWRLSEPAVELASRRYEREDILVGRLRVSGEELVEGEWSYLAAAGRRDRKVAPVSVAEFMDAGVALVADDMAARFAVAPTEVGAEGILMSVTGIRSYADYAAVVSWLERVELIERANVERVQGDRIQLRLVAQADAEQLAGIIRLNEQFVPAPSGDVNEQLSYRGQN